MIFPPIEYHLRELDIALNPDDPRHCMPRIEKEDRRILEIGCGIGQLFIASGVGENVCAVGIDIDHDALVYGKTRYGNINYVEADGDSLPFRDGSFDLMVSRVSLPYTNLPEAIRETARILRRGGRVWFSLHPPAMALKILGNHIRSLRPRGTIHGSYVMVNGLLLHFVGKVVPFPPTGSYESFQTERGMRRLLRTAGFREIAVMRERHFVVTAIKE